MPGHTHVEESTEEYFEAIYRLERDGPGVTTSGLAPELGIAAAAVSGMLTKLSADGYVESDLSEPKRPGVPATVHGLRSAAGVIVDRAPLGGPSTVRVDSVPHPISLELARMVTVLPA